MTQWGAFLFFIGNGSVLKRAERHIGRSLRFRWWADVFNRGVLRTLYGERFYGFAYCIYLFHAALRPSQSRLSRVPFRYVSQKQNLFNY